MIIAAAAATWLLPPYPDLDFELKKSEFLREEQEYGHRFKRDKFPPAALLTRGALVKKTCLLVIHTHNKFGFDSRSA